MQPRTQMFSNFTEDVQLAAPVLRSDSDPRPFYLFSPGDHIHRVTAHDSVPHVWAGRVQVVKNYLSWVDGNTSMTDGLQTRETIRGEKAVRQVALPIWAGSIVNTIMRDHADVMVVTLETFEGRDEQEVNPELFNRLIAGGDNLPYVIEPDWRVRNPAINSLVPPLIEQWKVTPKKYLEIANEKGGLAVRRALVVDGIKAIQASDTPQRQIYSQAAEEVLEAYDRFSSAMHLYLDEQERLIQSDKEAGTKAQYDPYDRLLLWLLGRKGIETARGITRDDMASLINSVKGNGAPTQPAMTRDDIAAIASAAAEAAVRSLPQMSSPATAPAPTKTKQGEKG